MRTIAIDAMGGENAPEAIIEAVLKAKGEMPDTKFLLFGDKEQLRKLIPADQINDQLGVVSTTEIIEDEDLNPSETSLEEAADYYGFNMAGFDGNPTEEEGLSDGAVVAIIFGILILGFGGLVIYSRKK